MEGACGSIEIFLKYREKVGATYGGREVYVFK
jgi:hypothetical protein